MSTHKSSDMFHVVVSTKELQDIDELDCYYSTQAHIKDYIITIESGTTGHQHLDSFVILTTPKRQDKFRQHVINTLYKHLPKEEHRNIKCVVNYLDPDPRYAIGYSLKENPKVIATSFKDEYLNESREYYKSNVERVNRLKEDVKDNFKGKLLTLDRVSVAYLDFCRKAGYDTMYYKVSLGPGYLPNTETRKDVSFKKFMSVFSEFIPFSMYQKINQDKLIEWVDSYLADSKGGVS